MPYIVMTSSAHVSGKARMYGKYRNVAVVEIDDGVRPSMISERAKGVRRIVKHYGSLNVGTTEKCQYRIAEREAMELARKLNDFDKAIAAAEIFGVNPIIQMDESISQYVSA